VTAGSPPFDVTPHVDFEPLPTEQWSARRFSYTFRSLSGSPAGGCREYRIGASLRDSRGSTTEAFQRVPICGPDCRDSFK
jgi:hypothetical protein